MKIAEITSKSPIEDFIVTSGALRVTDPCYGYDVASWCAGELQRVKNGVWGAHVGYHQDAVEKAARVRVNQERGTKSVYSGRVAYLHICHQDSIPQEIGELNNGVWRSASAFDVGVDSGQAGFFDLDFYKYQDQDTARHNEFYRAACHLTCDMENTGVEHNYGVIENGAVSSTGYGDGLYDCYFRLDDSEQIVEAIIVFISEDEESE